MSYYKEIKTESGTATIRLSLKDNVIAIRMHDLKDVVATIITSSELTELIDSLQELKREMEK